MSNIASPVWFITGCSTGFGREPRKRTIANGWPTVVAARNKNAVADLVDRKDNAFAIDLDVTSAAQITAAVTSAEDRFGRIDGLVNNAGYGYLSSVEEGDEDEIRDQFEANVFDLFADARSPVWYARAAPGSHHQQHLCQRPVRCGHRLLLRGTQACGGRDFRCACSPRIAALH